MIRRITNGMTLPFAKHVVSVARFVHFWSLKFIKFLKPHLEPFYKIFMEFLSRYIAPVYVIFVDLLKRCVNFLYKKFIDFLKSNVKPILIKFKTFLWFCFKPIFKFIGYILLQFWYFLEKVILISCRFLWYYTKPILKDFAILLRIYVKPSYEKLKKFSKPYFKLFFAALGRVLLKVGRFIKNDIIMMHSPRKILSPLTPRNWPIHLESRIGFLVIVLILIPKLPELALFLLIVDFTALFTAVPIGTARLSHTRPIWFSGRFWYFLNRQDEAYKDEDHWTIFWDGTMPSPYNLFWYFGPIVVIFLHVFGSSFSFFFYLVLYFCIAIKFVVNTYTLGSSFSGKDPDYAYLSLPQHVFPYLNYYFYASFYFVYVSFFKTALRTVVYFLSTKWVFFWVVRHKLYLTLALRIKLWHSCPAVWSKDLPAPCFYRDVWLVVEDIYESVLDFLSTHLLLLNCLFRDFLLSLIDICVNVVGVVTTVNSIFGPSAGFFSVFFSFFFILVIFIVLSLIITVAIASLTLVERRVLSLVQRRVGPNHVGFRGRLQFIADALKLLLKGITIPDLTNRKLFVFVPALSLFVCYTFWLNTVWGPNLSIIELEYNLVYAAILSGFFSICIILTGVFSRNKYAVLAAVRCSCMFLNLEILIGFLLLFITGASESFSFSAAVQTQNHTFYLMLVMLPIAPIVMITFLLETNRAPFDLTEAESELVAGYTTELGGFFFALFYLGEYFHLFLFSLTISLCLFGGWF